MWAFLFCFDSSPFTENKSFSRTHRIDKNYNIGITGFTMWKQKNIQQKNVTPLSIELTTSAIQV